MLHQDMADFSFGSYAINPATGQKIPIWIADYVLGGYGTGAVMGVPAHDDRDFVFAEKFELPVIEVIERPENDIDTTASSLSLTLGATRTTTTVSFDGGADGADAVTINGRAAARTTNRPKTKEAFLN